MFLMVSVMNQHLRITEIFYSLQGETSFTGLPTVFVRLTGCPLRCQYCDTAYAFSGGQKHSLDAILTEIQQYKTQYVCVTGGEPLAQPACIDLLRRLCDEGYTVSIETSGAMDIRKIDPRVHRMVDIKTPDSKECHRNLWSNIDHLTDQDEAKFVICSKDDFDWACETINTYDLTNRCPVLFSPSADEVKPSTLADWILSKQLNVRFQLQLHKILNVA